MNTIHDPRTPSIRRRRRTVAAGVAASLAAMFAAAAPAVADADTQTPIGPRLQAILDQAATSFPGVALHVRMPGQPAWSGAAGTADVRRAVRMRPGDTFRAGSIMKTFVSAATLQLVEEGKLRLHDALPAVLPRRVTARFPEARRITVRMLLNHTSGLNDYAEEPRFDREVIADPQRRWRVGELLGRAAAMPRLGAPGEHHAYSNTNYNLLGLVLERATGKPWRTVIRERIVEPLRLSHTTLPEPGDVRIRRHTAHGYMRVNGRLLDLTRVDSSMSGAAGGNALSTNTQDLTRFLRGLLAGKLFERQETLRAMRDLVPAPTDYGLVGYGLGLERYVMPGGVELVGHMGTGAGYRAFMFRLPAQRIDFTLITTAPEDPAPVLFPVLQALTDAAA